MQIREATIGEKEKWNEFVRTNEAGSFLQSYEWGDFLAQVKDKVWRFVVEKDNEWLAVFFIYKQNMQLGQSVLYCPRGPVFLDKMTDSVAQIFSLIVKKINEIAKNENGLTFELDPLTNDQNWLKVFGEHRFEKTKLDMQPRHTLILDLRKEEEDLLNQMNQKTRYNIRLAQKKGVEIIADSSMYKEFYELLKKTMQRQKFIYFSQEYFKKLLKVPFARLYLVKFEGKIIAASIMVFWNDTATYLFGASDYKFRNIMAPHLLQWQAIKDAKAEGLWFYDFWGAAPPDSTGREANWAGFTKFKMGFSPNAEITEYIGTYEKVYQPVKLGLYRFIRKAFKA
ncbi:peptidoglycan bridge formation glycyltransferase FemA/FemB family protein [Candidatus Kuenenbacteria bacterium]|nr:peptidoglycan bridge formation glycyltransferase FemA/FemB family protein [Candidatus Kuenenbacteria bacterium]